MGTKHLIDRVAGRIYFIRSRKVLLDSDLASLYGVPTFRLNEQVKRNQRRFPQDFMFQLSRRESISLRSQIAILKRSGRGRHRKYRPYAFTEQGVAMLSSVLGSERAILVNIAIMRAFVQQRRSSAVQQELSRKFKILEEKIERHDVDIQDILDAIRRLVSPPLIPKPRIGFRPT